VSTKYSIRHKLVAVLAALIFALSVSPLALGQASAQPTISGVNAGATMMYTPTLPVWNLFNPNSMVAWGDTNEPLAIYSLITGKYIPVVASNIYINYANKTMIVTVRKGLYWYNGSATIPFTAWDVYAEDYIADKVEEYWYPMLAPSNITVLNNYTIRFVFTSGMQVQVPYVLTQYLSMPYEVWKPVLQKVEKMSMTQAASYATNITRIWVPAWSLGPYYVVSVTPPAILEKLDPPNLLAAWNQIFPYHTWQYYSPDYIIYQMPNTQAMDYLIAGTAASTTAFLSKAQYEVTEADGALVVLVPGDDSYGLTFNTTHYPLNIPQVRQALYYAINKTEVTDSWGLYMDDHDFSPFPPGTPLPHWLSSIMVNCSYDPAKAASILESLGFYKKNGNWYTPNGTEFTLAIQGPSGYTDWMTTVEDAANQLTKFGIPTTLYADSTGTYTGTMWPAADYQVGIYWLPGGFT